MNKAKGYRAGVPAVSGNPDAAQRERGRRAFEQVRAIHADLEQAKAKAKARPKTKAGR